MLHSLNAKYFVTKIYPKNFEGSKVTIDWA